MSKLTPFIVVLVLASSTLTILPALALTGPGDGPVPVAEALTSTDRVVLVELVTAGWCPTCPDADHALEEMQDNYTRDQLVILAYHKVDDLSNADGDARQAFYEGPYQPTAFFDGMSKIQGNKGSVGKTRAAYETQVDARLDKPSPVALTVEGWTDTSQGHGMAYVNITALSDPGFNDLRLHVAVFEDDFGPWNGGNGVKQHHWVTRQLLTGKDGQTLDLKSGGSKALSFNYDASAYAQDLDQVGVIAFIQSSGATREVVQAGYMKEHVSAPLNSLPEFTNPGVTPGTGNTSTTFRYEIGYRDVDDDAPVKAQVFIDDLPYDLTTDHPNGPFTDWLGYYHETPLTVGDDHTYRFVFSDGKAELRIPDPTQGPAVFTGPVVEPPTSAPTLSLPAVEPAQGDGLTLRTFSVVYTDGEGDPPVRAQLFIDGLPYNMTGQGTDYQRGVTYTYSVRIGPGDHEYHYEFGDGVHGARLPSGGSSTVSARYEVDRIQIRTPDAMDGVVVVGDAVTLGFDDEDVPEGLITSYRWESDLDGVLGDGAEVTFTPTEGDHEITLTVTTSDGTGYSTKLHLVTAAAMAVPVVDDVLVSPAEPVEGDTVTFTVTVGNDGNDRAEDLLVRLLDPSGDLLAFHEMTVPVEPGETGDAVLEWKSSAGTHDLTVEAGNDTMQVTVVVKENLEPTIDLTIVGVDQGEKAEFDVGQRIHFVGLGSDPEGGAVTYSWNFGDGSTSEEVEPEHSYGKAGTYTVAVTVTDARGASSTTTQKVVIVPDSTPGLAAYAVLAAVLTSATVSTVLRRRRR